MLSHRLTSFLFVLMISFFTQGVWAASPLFQVSVPFSAEQNQAIDPLLSSALTKVLIRLTGDAHVIEQPAVVQLLKTPRTFLDHYEQNSMPTPSLVVTFDEQSLKQALIKINIPFWEGKRPTIIVWWLAEGGDEASRLLTDAQPEAKSIQAMALEEGFPIRFPIDGLAEQALADKKIFEADMPEGILQASQVYGGNAILLAYSANPNQITWRLWIDQMDKKPIAQGEITADSPKQTIQKLFSAVNEPLAKVFIAKADKTAMLDVTIKNINFQLYAQINKVMSSFGGQLIETTSSQVRYKVEADPSQLKAQLGLLHFVPQNSSDDQQDWVFIRSNTAD